MAGLTVNVDLRSESHTALVRPWSLGGFRVVKHRCINIATTPCKRLLQRSFHFTYLFRGATVEWRRRQTILLSSSLFVVVHYNTVHVT